MVNFKNGLASITRTANKGKNVIVKHSPLLLTVTGALGLGATAYLAYKARPKVEEALTRYEEASAVEDVPKVFLVRDIAESVWVPAVVGVASVAAIAASYKIMNNRILNLTATVTSLAAEQLYYSQRLERDYGKDVADRYEAHLEEPTTVNVDGEKKEVYVQPTVLSVPDLSGRWFKDSSEYVSDDHDYNLAFIESVKSKLDLRIFQRGTLLLNEVLDELGFERERAGALIGWSTADSFSIDTMVVNILDEETGEVTPSIRVKWPKPSSIYDKVEYEGRYSIYGG